ncbi:MAG: DUF4139 domain-containing protein [Lachnospiraceae bacterium]|nr:DUF4139 domain-containing protein [Lachnospiraceae bacterium]
MESNETLLYGKEIFGMSEKQMKKVSQGEIVKAAAVSADLYLQGAIADYRGTMSLEEGSNIRYIQGLPDNTDPARSRIRLGADIESCHLLGIEKVQIGENLPRDTIQALEDEIEALGIQYNAWRDNSNMTNRENMGMDGVTAYIEALPERLLAISGKIHEKQKELDKAREELQRKEEDQKILVLAIEVTAKRAGDFPFILTAENNETFWYPYYEIYVTSLDKPIQARLRARISQTGPADWEGVSLKLLAGPMQRMGTKPTLQTWRIGFYKPAPVMTGMTMMGSSAVGRTANYLMSEAVCCEDGAADEEEILAPRMLQNATVSREMVMEFTLPGTYRIPRNKETIIDVSQLEIPVSFQFESVPKLNKGVFLTGTIEDVKKWNLLSCDAYLYYENINVGTTRIPEENSGKPFVLSLGRDDRLIINRRKTRDHHEQAFLRGMQYQNDVYEISVTNRRDDNVEVVIYDQLPVSTDEKITVEATELSGAAVEEETGQVKWNLTLAPEQTEKRILSYTISYPKNTRIQ